MAKTVIFDMDGVIVDSEGTNIACEIDILKQAGVAADPVDHARYLGVSSEDTWRDLKERFDLPLPAAAYIAEADQLKEERFAREGVRPIQGIEALIDWLLDKGYRLAVASASPKSEILAHTKALGLHEAFEVMVSAEEVPRSKPAPDVFLRAADLLGVQPDTCLVFEDSRNGSLAAKAAGMTCIGFANPDYPEQDLSVCDRIISDYREVLSFLD